MNFYNTIVKIFRNKVVNDFKTRLTFFEESCKRFFLKNKLQTIEEQSCQQSLETKLSTIF